MTKQIRVETRAIGYVRVSTAEQANTGVSLEAQRSILRSEAERRGWHIDVVAEQGTAKDLKRPLLQDALRRLDHGVADVLMATRLDRVSRSVADFAGLLDRAARRGWGLVLLSPSIETQDAAGRFTANVLASAAQYERELIGVRTREGMAARRAQGVRMGRPREVPDGVYRRVKKLRDSGLSFVSIASDFERRGILTAGGSSVWRPSTLRRMYFSYSREQDTMESP